MNLINDLIRQDRKATNEELKLLVKHYVASDFTDSILNLLKDSELLRLAAIGIFSHFEAKQLQRTLTMKKICAILHVSETSFRNWFPPDEKPFILLIKSVKNHGKGT